MVKRANSIEQPASMQRAAYQQQSKEQQRAGPNEQPVLGERAIMI